MFLGCLNVYLNEYAFANANGHSFWTTLSRCLGRDLSKASVGIEAAGFPFLTVTESNENQTITIRQNGFFEGGELMEPEDEILYWIPLALKTLDENGIPIVNITLFLSEREATFPLPDVSNGFYQLNANSFGFYRVRYTPERLKKFAEAYRSQSTLSTAEDRIGIVTDLRVMCPSGRSSTPDLLDLISAWKDEDRYKYL